MEEIDQRILSSNNAVPVKHVKRPTIIRATQSSGATNNDEDHSADPKTSSVDSEPQPTENSEVVNRRLPPARPSTGPSKQSSVKASARPASFHFRTESTPKPRPASVHLPLSHTSNLKDRPSAGKPQKKRPEITVVSARPLSEVIGFSKGVGLPSAPLLAAKPPTGPTPKPAVPTPNPASNTTPNPVSNTTPSNTPDEASSHSVAAPRRRSSNPDQDTVEPTQHTVDVEESSGVNGTSVMSGAPPPLPTSRPKGPYIPPPLPSSRPKGAYVPPASSVSEGKASSVISEPIPVPKPRRQSASDLEKTSQDKVNEIHSSQPVTQNHVPRPRDRGHVESETHTVTKSDSTSRVPTIPDKPQLPPHVPCKPAQKPAVPHPNTALKPIDKPQLPQPVASTKPIHQTDNTAAKSQAPTLSNNKPSGGPQASKTTMPLMPPSGQKYSRADILSLFDNTFQKNSKSDSQKKVGDSATRSASTGSVGTEQTKAKNQADALQFASVVGQNTSAQDVKNISGGVKVVKQSEDGRKAASSVTRIAKSTASDVRSSDTSSGDLKWQIASSAAKNVSADDAKNMGRAGVSIAKSEEGRKAASSIFNITRSSMNQMNQSQSQNPTARARPQRATQQESSLGSLMGLMPPPKTPSQTAPKPPSSSSKSAPVPKFKISSESFAAGASRFKPTIIRPGAEKPGSKPNSRSNSPESKRKGPPPRPSSGPQFRSKGTAPTRPNAPSSSQSSSNMKPKRRAPLLPGGAVPLKPSQSESLPPRPGPGHPLYNKYMVSEPHGIALYDYKPIQSDELGFKANDVIILVQRIDADWLRGRCGNAEGLLPATFLKIIKDLPQTDSKWASSVPSAVAVFNFEGPAADELTFNEGDNIILLDRVGDQWYRGQCKGSTGIFPANHVRVIEDLPVQSATTSSSNDGTGPRCKAKFEYSSSNPEDLNFQPGDIIKLIEDIGFQWLKGQLNGRTGIFPDSFVDIIEDLPMANKKSSAAVNGATDNKVTAVFDFEAAESNEISFRAGDKITILSQVSQEWLHGELRGGVRGNLPSSFVDHIPANLPTFSTSRIGECVAKFDFEPTGEGELALKVGDRITLLEYVGDDWLQGSLGSKEGIFPKSFVEILGKGASSSVRSSLGNCTARYDFIAEEPDELTIVNGDVIEILEHISADWLVGRLNGQTGKFPKAFVDIR